MSKKTETAVAPRQEQLPAQYDYGDDAGVGYQDQQQTELQIPFLALLQGLSPQVTGEQGKGVEGAKPGLLYNTVTGEVLGDSVQFIPAHREYLFTEWVPRKMGGGFKGRHRKESELVEKALAASKEFGIVKTPEGNDLIETVYLYGIVERADKSLEPVVVAFTKTKFKVWRRWNTAVNMFTVQSPNGQKQRPPRYAHLLTVRTVPDKNAKGSFFNLALDPANATIRDSLLRPDDARFIAAKELAAMVTSGQAKAAEETQNAATSADGDEEARPTAY